MIWFDRLFPVFMLLWPVVFVHCVRVHPTRAEPDHREAAARLLWLSLAAVALFGVGQLVLEAVSEQRTGLRAGWPLLNATAVSMLLFFVWGRPALTKRSPGWGTSVGTTPVRSASLTPRDFGPALPGWAMPAGWLVFAACLAVMIWTLTEGVRPVIMVGLMAWPFMTLGLRRVALEPEPLDPGGSPELLAAYATSRSLKAWGFWCLGLCMTLLFTVVAAISLSAPMTAGLIGGLAGSALGIAGGAFGVCASLARARINERLQDLSSE